jgi:hypothetical protein
MIPIHANQRSLSGLFLLACYPPQASSHSPLNSNAAAPAIASCNPQRAQLQQLTAARWTAQSPLDQVRSPFASIAPVLKSP